MALYAGTYQHPVVRDMITAGNYGINNSSKKKQVCEARVETKSTKVACKENLVEGFKAIIVHSGVCGPIQY